MTELGIATRRWLAVLAPANASVLGRHAAYALAACQLRNPTGAGSAYAPEVAAFPFSYIWRSMLALDGRISSQELNQAVFHAVDEASLEDAIERVRLHRANPAGGCLLPEVIAGDRQNDRIVPWISLASFGYLLIGDKRETGDEYYRIRPQAQRVLAEAAEIRHRHREFNDVQTYVRHISTMACLPRDAR